MLDAVTLESWDNCTTYALKRSGWWDIIKCYSFRAQDGNSLENYFEFKPLNNKVSLFIGMIVGWEFVDRYYRVPSAIKEDGTILEQSIHARYHFGVIEQLEPIIKISDLTRFEHYAYPYIRCRSTNDTVRKSSEVECSLPNIYLKFKNSELLTETPTTKRNYSFKK